MQQKPFEPKILAIYMQLVRIPGQPIWPVSAVCSILLTYAPSGSCARPPYRRIISYARCRKAPTESWWAGDTSATAITCTVIT